MKKLRKMAVCFALITFSTITAFAASGESWYANRTLKLSWYTDWDARGDFISGTMAGYGSEKQVFVRMGSTGSYSSWVGRDHFSVTVRDYGPFGAIGKNDYEVYEKVR